MRALRTGEHFIQTSGESAVQAPVPELIAHVRALDATGNCLAMRREECLFSPGSQVLKVRFDVSKLVNGRSPVNTRFQGEIYGASLFGGASGIRTPDLRIMIPSL